MLLINNNIQHDQYRLPRLTGLEATATYLYLQNNKRLLFVSAYLPPTSTLTHADLDSIFTQHDSVILVGDLNSKHAAWCNTSENKNGKLLLSYCTTKNIILNHPDQTTHFPHNAIPSILDIALTKQCPISKPQAVPALSSDHNPIVFKILLYPLLAPPRTLYDYNHANWPLFRSILDHAIPAHPPSLLTTDLDDAVTTFETAIRQAATSAIPKQTVRTKLLTLPPTLRALLKLKNHYRRRYQRSRLPIHYYLYSCFSHTFSTHLSQLRNTKWTSFLRTLHPQSSQFWRITRYFRTSTPSIPPLSHQGTQIYQTPLKAEILARQFELAHHLTLNMGSNNHFLSHTTSQQILPPHHLLSPKRIPKIY